MDLNKKTVNIPILPLCIAVVLMSAVSCQNSGSIRDIVTSENTEADFGVIKEKDGPCQANLLIPNTTSDTLLPTTVLTRCSCVIASIEETPVAPGETLKVAVTYNPSYRSGIFMEEIGVRCLGRNGLLSLIIKGEVIPMQHGIEEDHPYNYGRGLHMSHEVLHYGKLAPGEKGKIFVRCGNSRSRGMNLSFEIPDSCHRYLSFKREHHLGRHGRDTVWFSFTMPESASPGDTLTFSVRPAANGKYTEKTLDIKAIAKYADNRM